MSGLKRNTARLFSNRGKLFALAMDLPQLGIVKGLKDPVGLIREHEKSKLDAFLCNVGIAQIAEAELLHKKLLLRTSSAGTNLASETTNIHRNHVSPERALAIGADAVVMMFFVGGNDYASGQDVAAAIDAYHRLEIPVIVEIMAHDSNLTQTFEIQANGARSAAELGADVIKAFYTERFDEVIAQCPIPIILAGGPKGVHVEDMARDAVASGIKGFCFGRNLYQVEDAAERIDRLDAILRG